MNAFHSTAPRSRSSRDRWPARERDRARRAGDGRQPPCHENRSDRPASAGKQHDSCSDHPAMDRTERGSGEGGEDARMVCQRSWYAPGFVAGESSPCQRESVSAVHVRAGRAARRSPVPAGQKNDTGRFLVAAVSIDDFACLSIDREPLADQSDGRGAIVRSLELFENGESVRPVSADRALRDEGSEPGASISAPSARLRDRSGTTQRRRPGLVGERAVSKGDRQKRPEVSFPAQTDTLIEPFLIYPDGIG